MGCHPGNETRSWVLPRKGDWMMGSPLGKKIRSWVLPQGRRLANESYRESYHKHTCVFCTWQHQSMSGVVFFFFIIIFMISIGPEIYSWHIMQSILPIIVWSNAPKMSRNVIQSILLSLLDHSKGPTMLYFGFPHMCLIFLNRAANALTRASLRAWTLYLKPWSPEFSEKAQLWTRRHGLNSRSQQQKKQELNHFTTGISRLCSLRKILASLPKILS